MSLEIKLDWMEAADATFYKRVRKLRSPAEILELVRVTVISMGVEMLSYHFTPPFHSQTSERSIVIAHGFPAAWMEKYEDPEFRALDPIPDIVMAQHDVLTWEDALSLHADRKAAKTFKSALIEHGMLDGIGIPFYGPGGRDAYSGISIGRPFSEEDGQLIRHLREIGQAAHLRISHLVIEEINNGVKLSMRESEVLSWIVAGKSKNDIATILDISVASVDTYLRRIYDKLDVNDRIKASLRALSQGLIKLP